MIWHVIKKDFRSLWWLGPALAVAALGYALGVYWQVAVRQVDSFASLFFLWPYIMAALAMVRTVQLDSPAILAADWHTRPLSRWDTLSAKALIGLCGVLLPWAVVDVFWSLSWGIGARDALSGAPVHMATLGAGLLLVMALAAATRTLMLFLLLVAGLLAAAIAAFAIYSRLIDRLYGLPLSLYASPGFIGLLGAGLSLLFAGAMFLLYHRRRVGAAWKVIVAAVLGVETVGILAGFALATHWPPIVGREVPQAQGIIVSQAGPSVSSVLDRDSVGGPFTRFSTPLKLQKPEDVTLEVDRRRVDRQWSDGPSKAYINGRGGELSGDLALMGQDPKVDSPQRLTASFRLRVRKTLPVVTLPKDGPLVLSGGGTCRVFQSVTGAGNIIRYAVSCVSGQPLCLKGEQQLPSGRWGTFLAGCAPGRALTGRYEMGAVVYRTFPAWRITQYREIGMIDRSFSTDWSIPPTEPFKASVPQPSSPVNGN